MDLSKLFVPYFNLVVESLNYYRFYYSDERKANRTAIYKVDREAHAKLYRELAEEKRHGLWLQTFVKGVGYRNFDSQYQL